MIDSRKLTLGAVAVGLVVAIYLLRPVLPPFLVGLLVAYVGNPLVLRLQGLGMSRGWSVSCVFAVCMLGIAGLVLVLAPLLVREIVSLVRDIPAYIEWARAHTTPLFVEWLDMEPPPIDLEHLRASLLANWKDAGGILADVVANVSRSGMALLGWVANAALIPVVSFYLLRDWGAVVRGVRDLLPRPYLARITRLALECDEVLGAFLRGQLMIMLLLGGIYSTGLWIIGLERAFVIGMLAGLACIVPYLGFVVGILAASVTALMQFQELLPLLFVAIVFGIGQLLESMVLTPWLMGERIGLHPVAILFAILAGGELAGFVGILLALPFAAVIRVFFRHVHDIYRDSDFYDGEEDVS